MWVFAIVGLTLPFICKFEACITEDDFKIKFVKELDKREIKDLIGENNYLDKGSQGVLHKIEWEKEEGPNKFRVLKQQLHPNDETFLNEIQVYETLGPLKLKHIPAYFGCVKYNDLYLILLEYIPFMTAPLVWNKKGLASVSPFYKKFLNKPPTEHLRLYRGIADAIAELHDHGFVHNDIKPDNILIKYDEKNEPVVVLVDFGFTSKHGMFIGSGTMEYMDIYKTRYRQFKTDGNNAEMEKIEKMTNHFRADIWAFGVSIYEYEVNEEWSFQNIFAEGSNNLDSIFTRISERVFDPKLYKTINLDICTEDKTSFIETLREMMASRELSEITAAEISKRFALLDETAQKIPLESLKTRKIMLSPAVKVRKYESLSDQEGSEEEGTFDKFLSFFFRRSSASAAEKEVIESHIRDSGFVI
jgi:serine/threonine protein kinase